MTNYGREEVTPDFHPDDNSIVVTAFYQVCGPASNNLEEELTANLVSFNDVLKIDANVNIPMSSEAYGTVKKTFVKREKFS